MPRPFWKGYLKLSLVTCPVTLTPATTGADKLRFHTRDRETGHRVESRYVDADTGKPVNDLAHAYAVGEDASVILEDEDLDAVALDTTRTLDIETFVPRADIEPVWLDRPHFLAPDDPVGEEAFAVIREAMAVTAMAGISRLVLYRRERAVLLEPRDRGIVAWTLRFGDEVRPPPFEGLATPKPAGKPLAMIKSLIAERTRPWSLDLLRDPVQDRLLALVEAERKGKTRKPKPAPAPEPQGNVVNIMDALKSSLAAERKTKKGK